MPQAIPTDAVPVGQYGEEIPQEGIGLADWYRAVTSGAYSTAGTLYGAAQYLNRDPEESALGQARQSLEASAEAERQKMSPRAQKALGAGILPTNTGSDIWDSDVSTSGALGLKIASAVPSLIASIVPGAVAARVAAGAGMGIIGASRVGSAVGIGSGALQSGGDVFGDIAKQITETPDAELQKDSDSYRGMRSMGMTEGEAKQHIINAAEGYKPVLEAAVTILTSKYGVESMAAKRAAGQATKEGFLRHAGIATAGEFTQEGTEAFTGELLKQQGLIDARGKGKLDWSKALAQALEEGVIGGIMGGGTGALTYKPHGTTHTVGDVDPSIVAATVNTGAATQGPASVAPTPVPANPNSAGAQVVDEPAKGQELAAVVAAAQSHPTGSAEISPTPPTRSSAGPVGVDQDVAAVFAVDPDSNLEGIPPLPPGNPVVTPAVQRVITQEPTAPVEATNTAPVQETPAAATLPATLPAGQVDASETAVVKPPAGDAPVLGPAQPAADITSEVTPAPAKYDNALAIVNERQVGDQIGLSLIQRKLGLKRSDGKVIIQRLEQEGVISPMDNKGKHTILKSEAPRPATLRPVEEVAKEQKSEQHRGARFTAAQAEQVALGKAQATTLTTDPAKFGTAADRDNTRAAAKRIVDASKKAGVEPDPLWQELSTLKLNAKASTYEADKARWMELRQQVADRQGGVQAAPAEPARRKATMDKEKKQAAEKATADKIKSIMESLTFPGAGDVPSVRAYINGLVNKAKAQGIILPKRVNLETTDPHVLHLQDAMKLTGKKGSAGDVLLFIGRDAKLRKGETADIAAERRANREMGRKDIEQAEAIQAAKAEKSPTANVVEEAVIEEVTQRQQTAEEKKAAEERAAKQAEIERTIAQRVTTGVNKAGTFEVQESRAAKARRLAKEKASRESTQAAKEQVAEHTIAESWTEVEGGEELQVEHPGWKSFNKWLNDLSLAGLRNKMRGRGEILYNTKGERIDASISPTFREVIGHIPVDALSDTTRAQFKFFSTKLAELIGDMPVFFTNHMKQIGGRSPAGLFISAKYHMPEGTSGARSYIAINRNNLDKFGPDYTAKLLIHEAVHGALYELVLENPEVEVKLTALRDEVYRQFRLFGMGERAGKPGIGYGLMNAHEFLSELVSNPDFQRFLADTPASPQLIEALNLPPSQDSLWQTAVKWFRNLFGLSPNQTTMLDTALQFTEHLFEVRAGRQQLDTSLNLEGINAAARSSFARTKQIALARRLAGRTTDIGPAEFNVEDARNLARDQSGAVRAAVNKFGYAVRTLDQLAQDTVGIFKGVAVNAVRDINEAIQRIAPYVKGLMQEGRQFQVRFNDIVKEHGAEMGHTLGQFFLDVSNNDVNIGPGAKNDHLGKDKAATVGRKARLAELQSQFNRFPPDVQQFILDTGEYFKNRQNEVTRQSLVNILKEFKGDLTTQMLYDITTGVMEGKLTDVHRGYLDNDGVFNDLKRATNFRLREGMYFPAVRQGKFVVVTTDRLPDTMGGTVIEQDRKSATLEWRALTDKAARAAYTAWAKIHGGANQQSVSKVYYLNGKVVDEATARGQPNVEVGYRTRVQLRGTYMFDTRREANAFIREHAADFERASEALSRQEWETSNDITQGQLATIMRAINGRQDLDSHLKNIASATLRQAAVMSMSGNRFQTRALPRRNVRGASTNVSQAIGVYSASSSQYLGKMKYMPAVREAFTAMRKETGLRIDEKGGAARTDLMNELTRRVNQNTYDPKDNSQLIQDVMTLSYMDKLMSPATSLINSLQVMMVTYPVLAGRYGPYRAAQVIGQAYRDIGALGAFGKGVTNTWAAARGFTAANLDTRDIVGSARSKLSAEKQALVDMLLERGALSQDAGQEIASAIDTGRKLWGTGLAKMDRIARQLPAAVEAVNRLTTALATYDLARAAGKSVEEAQLEAFHTTQNTQGDYGAHNAPAFFNKPILKPAMQFKKYAQMMSYLLYDMVKRAAFETGQERKVAIKQLTGIFGVQIAMAGALGLPGLEIIKAASIILGLLGIGDGWDDTERKLRRIADESFGKTWGELVSRGVLSRALRIDLSTRVSLSDMWIYGEPKSMDRDGVSAYIGNLVAGAPGSLVLDWWDGLKAAGNGDFGKAAIQMIPNKFISDTLKAVKGRADPGVAQPITLPEAALQSFGLRSARMAEKSYETGGNIAERKKMDEEKKALTKQYLLASSKSELARVKAKALEHNKKAEENGTPTLKVFIKSLDTRRGEKASERAALLGE